MLISTIPATLSGCLAAATCATPGVLGAPIDEAPIPAVRGAVETRLTKKQREVVEAHFFEGASQSEIARRLGVSQ